MWGLGRNQQKEAMIEQAHQLIDRLTAEKMILDLEKEQLIHRQTEIWSLGSDSIEIKDEYRKICSEIAFDAKKILVLQSHIHELTLGRYHCQNGECKRLIEALKITDPCLGLKPDPINVDYNSTPPVS